MILKFKSYRLELLWSINFWKEKYISPKVNIVETDISLIKNEEDFINFYGVTPGMVLKKSIPKTKLNITMPSNTKPPKESK